MRCFKTILIALLLCPIAIAAQGWNDNTYKQIEQRVKQPEFANRSFVITKYGAGINLSAAKNQIAINKAILSCSKAGGGKVIVPSGTSVKPSST